MISASKLAALRLSLQPLTCFAVTPASGPAPTPAAPYTPAPLSASHLSHQQQQTQQVVPPPKRVRLSPVPDATLCSPTPTKAAFLLTPTRFAFSNIPSPSETEASSPFLSVDPRSPMLSTCVCEGCDNLVSSERNTCAKCREIFLNLLSRQDVGFAQMHIRSPVQATDQRPSMELLSSRSNTHGSHRRRESDNAVLRNDTKATSQESGSCSGSSERGPLSVAHPRPCPIETGRHESRTVKAARKSDSDLEDLASPDALYFGKRSRRTYGHIVTSRGRSTEPSFTILKTSARMQRVEDEDMSP